MAGRFTTGLHRHRQTLQVQTVLWPGNQERTRFSVRVLNGCAQRTKALGDIRENAIGLATNAQVMLQSAGARQQRTVLGCGYQTLTDTRTLVQPAGLGRTSHTDAGAWTLVTGLCLTL